MSERPFYQSEERKGIAQEGEWTDQDLAVKADTPLVDAGTGNKLILRFFDFEWNKGTKPEDITRAVNNKQEFFNNYARYIRDFLWKDGLKILENQDPKMIFSPKGYRIAVVCQANSNTFIDQKGKTLQDIFKKKKK